MYISWWIGNFLQENSIDNYILKNENIFPKKLKQFLIFMKCEISTLCMWFTYFEPCEKFNNFRLTNGGFLGQ